MPIKKKKKPATGGIHQQGPGNPLEVQWLVCSAFIAVKVNMLVVQSCLTLCDPMDYSLPGSSVHGILQARILEWVAILFSRGSSRPRNQTQISSIAGRFFIIWAIWVHCHGLGAIPEILEVRSHKLRGATTKDKTKIKRTNLHSAARCACFPSGRFSAKEKRKFTPMVASLSIPSLSLTSSWLACFLTCRVILSLGNYFSKEASLSIFSIDSKKTSEKRWAWMRSGEREELSRVGNNYT